MVGKGENAGYQYFLLFPQCFQKGYYPRVVKSPDCVVKDEPFPKQFTAFMALDEHPFQNIMGKGENAGYEHFLLFPHCFQKAAISRSIKVGTVW